MPPTIPNNEIGGEKNPEVSIVVDLKGDEKIIGAIKKKSPELLSYEKKVEIGDHHEILLFTLCRKYFLKAYKELKLLLP